MFRWAANVLVLAGLAAFGVFNDPTSKDTF